MTTAPDQVDELEVRRVDASDPAPASEPATNPSARSDVDPADVAPARAAALLLVLLLVLVPLATAVVTWATPTGDDDWTRRVQLAPFDLALLAIVGWAALHLGAVRDLFRSRSVQVGVGLFGLAFVAAYAAHPSPLGVSLAARFLAGICVIACCSVALRTPQTRSLVLGTITAVGLAEAGLGMAQSVHGASFAVAPIDWGAALFPFGTSFAGQGSLPHPYHLTAFLAVAEAAALLGLRHARGARWPWLASLAALSAGTAITYSRAGAVALVAVVAAAALGRRDRRVLLLAAAALVVGFAIGAASFGDGWVARSDTTLGKTGSSADSDRGQRLREARELIESSPVVGVGPGRYTEALLAVPHTGGLQPAHNLLAHETAEYGIPGGLVVVGLLVLLGFRVLRGGAWTAMVAAPTVALAMLGTTPYLIPTSLAMTAIWLGLVRGSLDPADPRP